MLVVDGSQPISEQDLRIIQTVARGRPRAGDRVQQVGPRRRGAPLLPRPRDRARPRAGAVGAADQHHRPHRLARRPAGAGARRGARGLGDPGRAPARSTRSSAGWSPSTRTRCAAASSRRSCSAPRPSTAPPTFVLFTSGKLEASLRALHRAPAARGVRLRRHPDRTCSSARARSASAADASRRRGYVDRAVDEGDRRGVRRRRSRRSR